MTVLLRKRWGLTKGTSLGVYATVVEAAVLLVCARGVVRFCFRRAAPWVFRMRRGEDRRPDAELELRVGHSVEAVVRLLRWKHCCLPAAMAVKAMLARRGFASTIHVGAGKRADGALHAHAWVEAGGEIVTGHEFVRDVTPIVREGGAG